MKRKSKVSNASRRALRLGPVESSRKSWAEMLPRLRRFKKEFGHCDVPEGWPDDKRLAGWVGAVRGRHRAGALRPEQKQALLALGFTFDPRQQEWQAMCRALTDFQRRFGHCAVPRWWKELPELGIWVANVRTRYHHRSRPRPGRTLNDEQVRQMDALGFVWHPREEAMRIALAGLTAFKAKHGHGDVPADYIDSQLVRAFGHFKKLHQKGQLEGPTLKLFQSLGAFLAKPRRRTPWDRRFEQLREFKERHGRTEVHKSDDAGLAHWLFHQRSNMREGRLDAVKLERLEGLGVREARIEDERWALRLSELEAFKKDHGHCDVPNTSKVNPALGKWCALVRQMKRDGRLKPARVKQLLAVGFEFAPQERDWDQKLAALKAFAARYGHTDVPRFFKESPGLGVWVSNVRVMRRQGRLSPQRIRAVDALGFSWEPLTDRWARAYARMKAFHDVHGHAAGPFTEQRLSAWAAQQRHRRGLGELSRDRIRKLDALGFAWRAVARWTLDPYLDQLAELRRRQGHSNIPEDSPHASLARWAATQRGAYRRQRLDPKLQRELEAIGFPLSTRDITWERHFGKLLQHLRHRRAPPERGGLGEWLKTQRALAEGGELELDREERLRTAGAL